MICGVVATGISGCGVCTVCHVVCDYSRTLHSISYVCGHTHTSLQQKQRTHKYMICCHNTRNNGTFIILTLLYLGTIRAP